MFRKATKEQAKLRLSIDGVSGSGKTYTALKLASRIVERHGGRIAVLDTEHGSASKYADVFDFDVVELEPPFDPRRYIRLMGEAAAAGYTVLVIDSLSHAWFGEGGLLDLVDEIAKAQAAKNRTAPNSYAAWKDGTAIQNQLADTIIRSPLHIIATLRAKADYVQDKDKDGRTKITKVGTAPIQREGLEYEFDITLSMDLQNVAAVVKTRCSALTDKVFAKPDAKLADIILDWLNAGAVPKAPPPATDVTGTDYERKLLDEVGEDDAGALNPAQAHYLDRVAAVFGKSNTDSASKWMVTRYTKGKTPDNIRTDWHTLSDDELVMVAETLEKFAAVFAKEFEAVRAMQVGAFPQ
jgi:hypothetical protein